MLHRFKWSEQLLRTSKLCNSDIEFMSNIGIHIPEKEFIEVHALDDCEFNFTSGKVLCDGSFVFAESKRDQHVQWIVCASTRRILYTSNQGSSFPSHVMNSCIRKFSAFRRFLGAALVSQSAKQFYRYSVLMQKFDPVAFGSVPFDLGQDVTTVTSIWEEMLLYHYWRFEDSGDVYEEEFVLNSR